MNHTCLRHALSALVIVSAMLACGLPGQAGQPVSGIDPLAMQTAVMGTAQAASTQTAAAAQPVPTRMTGTTLQQLPDGLTIYSDYDAGFEVWFPVGWLAVRPNSEEFQAALAKEGKANPLLQDSMLQDMASYNAELDRLFIYALRPDLEKHSLFGFGYMEWKIGHSIPIESVNMQDMIRELESSSGSLAFHANNAELWENNQAVKLIEVDGTGAVHDEQGVYTTFWVRTFYFKPSADSLARMMFAFPEEYQVDITTDVQWIANSIRLIVP